MASVSLTAALALASVAAFAARSQAANGVSVDRFPVNFPIFNPCTNETIDFSGSALTVRDDPTPEDNHGLTFHSVDINVKGIGETTGRRYIEHFVATISLQGTEDTSDNSSFAETNSIHSRVITPGPANDLVFNIVFHFTINATGEVVAFHNRVTAEVCV